MVHHMRSALWLVLLPFLVHYPPKVHVEKTEGQLRLVSASGWQTVSMPDGGLTGLYYDAPSYLLQGQEVSDVVLLGLGGGEMLRATRRVQPAARLTGVEIDPDVAALARTAFGMEKLGVKIVVDDAQSWVTHQPLDSYDALLIDIYEDSALPSWVTGRLFLWRCELLLRRGGLIAINVNNDPARVTALFSELHALGFERFGALVFKTNTVVSARRPHSR